MSNIACEMRTIPAVLIWIFILPACNPVVKEYRDLKSRNYEPYDRASRPDSMLWPDNAQAAVCLTYDDGLDCHLDVVLPDLEKYGFKGSFYVSGTSLSLFSRMEDWRDLARNGHELGTIPARKDGLQIPDDLRIARTLMKAIDGKDERTLAYVGEDSIQPLFLAVRADGAIPDDMHSIDLFKVPSRDMSGVSADVLIAFAEEAAAKGSLAVYRFHSVGIGDLNISRNAHEQLLQYLDDNRNIYWTDTFLNVVKHVKQESKRVSNNKVKGF